MSLANFQRNAKNINEYYMKYDNNVEVRKFSKSLPVHQPEAAHSTNLLGSFLANGRGWWTLRGRTYSRVGWYCIPNQQNETFLQVGGTICCGMCCIFDLLWNTEILFSGPNGIWMFCQKLQDRWSEICLMWKVLIYPDKARQSFPNSWG